MARTFECPFLRSEFNLDLPYANDEIISRTFFGTKNHDRETAETSTCGVNNELQSILRANFRVFSALF